MKTDTLETQYLRLFWQYQLCQWENYADDANHNLSLIDDEIYSLLSPYQNAFEDKSRYERVFNAIVKRACVDNHPDVSRLRNKLDDWDNYSDGIESLSKENPVLFRQNLGLRMREDVLELMRLRQNVARKIGFDSYPDLVLWSEDLSLSLLKDLLKKHLDKYLPIAVTLAKEIGVTWKNWFYTLDRLGSQNSTDNCLTMASEMLQRLGFNEHNAAISFVIKDQSLAGYAGAISVPDDVRILASPVKGLSQVLTLFHELGHAVAYAMNKQPGIYKTWTGVYDEAMAVLFERIAAEIFLDDEQKKIARNLWLLEETRCATSAVFELQLWNQPHNAEDLYIHHYGAWEIEMLPEYAWAVDSFRSIDPVYIHNYVIAGQVADRTLVFLKNEYNDNFLAWGEWLAENYYSEGRYRTLAEKLAKMGVLTFDNL